MANRIPTDRAGIRRLLEQRVLEVTQKITLDVHSQLVVASPVDTGRFRAAWQVEVPDAPEKPGRVSNNTEYAVPLADGHSPQAPAGWIENALVAAVKGS